MRAVDTNVLVRLITRDDARQVGAAEAFVANGAWVPHLALAEATWVLESVYDRDRKSIVTPIEMLLRHRHLTVQDADVVTEALDQFRRHSKVGFSDCLMVEVARRAGHVPLGTFDRAVGRIDGAQPM
jgi:predicted nucleic-acid-binding protein